ncbi:hypothetical protein E2C01_009967 [Portunus trituberculatus]|uniref:Uncharacterized protein n=1 Tax=Portunus trituberculatus TaxID=210409 RepID=A0A5B7D764_PORTR|nr:hypothetical protein [Portunus trituberculatus]
MIHAVLVTVTPAAKVALLAADCDVNAPGKHNDTQQSSGSGPLVMFRRCEERGMFVDTNLGLLQEFLVD